MYQLMLNNLSEEDLAKLKKGKEVSVGYERKMKCDQQFLDDLKKATSASTNTSTGRMIC